MSIKKQFLDGKVPANFDLAAFRRRTITVTERRNAVVQLAALFPLLCGMKIQVGDVSEIFSVNRAKAEDILEQIGIAQSSNNIISSDELSHLEHRGFPKKEMTAASASELAFKAASKGRPDFDSDAST